MTKQRIENRLKEFLETYPEQQRHLINVANVRSLMLWAYDLGLNESNNTDDDNYIKSLILRVSYFKHKLSEAQNELQRCKQEK